MGLVNLARDLEKTGRCKGRGLTINEVLAILSIVGEATFRVEIQANGDLVVRAKQ